MKNPALRLAILSLFTLVPASQPASAADAQAAAAADAAPASGSLAPVVVTGDAEREAYRVARSASATRTDTPLQELPQSVQVVSRQLMDDLGATRLDDLLPYVSGVARQNNFGGLWDNYSIRGFAGAENGGMNILWNGFASNRGYAPPRDTANLETVDFLKGPAAALYGNSEPGGTVNMVTKKPQYKAANTLDLSLDGRGLYRAAVDSTGPLSTTVAYRLNAAVEARGGARDQVRSQREFLAPALTWALGAHTVLNYEAELLRQRAPLDRGVTAVKGDAGALPASLFLGEPRDGDIRIENQNHLLTLEHRLDEDWQLRAGVFHKQGTLAGYSTEAAALQSDNRTLWRQRRFRDYGWRDTSLQAELGGKFATGEVGHEVLVGVEANRMTLEQRMLRANPNAGSPYAIDIGAPLYGQAQPTPMPSTDTAERQSGVGLFLQDQLSLGQRWKLLAGVRADTVRSTLANRRSGADTRQEHGAVSPRLGVNYLISDQLSAYASAGKSFRANSGSDVNGAAFSPETARAGELGLKWQSADGRGGATLALFDIVKQNVLAADPANAGFSIAAGEVRSRGVELDYSGKLGRHWRLTGNLAYTDAYVSRDTTLAAGARLLNVPRASGGVLAVYEDGDARAGAWGAGGGINYVGPRNGDQAGSFSLPGYALARALAYWQPTPRLKLSLDVNNLFNKRYAASSYNSLWIMPGDERSVTLAMRLGF